MDRASKVALGLLAFVLVSAVVLDAEAKGNGKKKGKLKMPTGPKVERVHTGGDDSRSWALSRFDAALAAVKQTETDDTTARAIALSLLTHWSIETASGVGEFNFNVGNINAGGAQSWFPIVDADGTVHPERSFDDLTSGVQAYVDLLNSARYKQAAYVLAHDPVSPDWYIALGKAGWFDPTKAKKPGTWEGAAAAFAARRKTLEAIVTASSATGDVGPDTSPDDLFDVEQDDDGAELDAEEGGGES